MPDESPVPTIHSALNDSVFAEQKPGIPTSFRIETEVRDLASNICYRHGTTLSQFLRQCCRTLAREYGAKVE